MDCASKPATIDFYQSKTDLMLAAKLAEMRLSASVTPVKAVLAVPKGAVPNPSTRPRRKERTSGSEPKA